MENSKHLVVTTTCWVSILLALNSFFLIQIRMISEILCLLAVVIRTFKDCIDAHRTGVSRWWNSIVRTWTILLSEFLVKFQKAFPEKVLHKFCQILVLCTVPLRVGCYLDDSFLVIENLLVVCIVIMSTLHFLFYCRFVF